MVRNRRKLVGAWDLAGLEARHESKKGNRPRCPARRNFFDFTPADVMVYGSRPIKVRRSTNYVTAITRPRKGGELIPKERPPLRKVQAAREVRDLDFGPPDAERADPKGG